MLRVTTEIVPYGKEEWKEEIFTVEIINDATGDRNTGNYDIRYYKQGEEYGKARIESYPRELGAGKLVYEALKVLLEEDV